MDTTLEDSREARRTFYTVNFLRILKRNEFRTSMYLFLQIRFDENKLE